MSRKRLAILRILSEAEDHPTVEEIFTRARALEPGLVRATVYRTVGLLEEQGLLVRLDFGDGRSRYEQAQRGPHYHLIDTETRQVIEFQDAEIEMLHRRIAERLGYNLVSHRIELYGTLSDS